MAEFCDHAQSLLSETPLTGGVRDVDLEGSLKFPGTKKVQRVGFGSHGVIDQVRELCDAILINFGMNLDLRRFSCASALRKS